MILKCCTLNQKFRFQLKKCNRNVDGHFFIKISIKIIVLFKNKINFKLFIQRNKFVKILNFSIFIYIQ